MDGTVTLRRLAAVKQPRTTQAAPVRNLNRGGIGGTTATVVQMVVHSTCRASQ